MATDRFARRTAIASLVVSLGTGTIQYWNYGQQVKMQAAKKAIRNHTKREGRAESGRSNRWADSSN
jgi:hypothetical protein